MLGARFEAVLARARTGDEAAWGELYDDLSGPLLGYLRGRGAPEPEDRVGDTFLDVARNLPSFTGDEDGFRSWVFTIAHRRGIDARRALSRRQVVPLPDEDLAPLAEAMEHGPDRIGEAVGRLADAQLLDGLLAVLTDEQREVLMLRFAADLDATMVAELTGRSANAVAALTLRALRTLRRTVSVQDGAYAGAPSSDPTDGR
jgi:RNA polymerase sigma-70 factor (ECF subfamily)